MFRNEIITKDILNSKMENTKENRMEHFIEYLKGYRSRVNKYYEKEYKEKPNCFNLMNSISITSLYVNDCIYDVISISGSNIDNFSSLCMFLEDSELNQLNTLPSHLKNTKILELVNIHENSCIDITMDYLSSVYYHDANINVYKEKSYADGIKKADIDYNSFELATSLNEGFNSFKDLSNFAVLDLDFIFSKVNDAEFKYELEESAKAYNAELYLASASTAEIAIETLLRIIIVKKMGKYKLPNETYILTSAKTLFNNRIIDERLFNRIKSINNLRHGIAHSATGEADKWDCEQILGLIKILIDTFF